MSMHNGARMRCPIIQACAFSLWPYLCEGPDGVFYVIVIGASRWSQPPLHVSVPIDVMECYMQAPIRVSLARHRYTIVTTREQPLRHCRRRIQPTQCAAGLTVKEPVRSPEDRPIYLCHSCVMSF